VLNFGRRCIPIRGNICRIRQCATRLAAVTPTGALTMDPKLLNLLTAGILALVVAGHSRAAPPARAAQSAAVLKTAIEDYLRVQTGGLPGQVLNSVGAIDRRLALAECPAPEVFTPPGARLWGKANLGVRCSSPNAWTIYVPVTVQVTGTYLVAARPLPSGRTLGSSDYTTALGDLTQLPAGVAQDPVQVLGRTLMASLAAGQPVRIDLLRAPTVIQQGQTVKLVAKGHGFEVTADGKALSQGVLGQTVQVRSPSGQTITGIARFGGVVEINN
jgi:flagella basal body P-ring formation protein FlgA